MCVCLSVGAWNRGWRPCCGQQGAACSTCLSHTVPTCSPTGRCGWPAATAGACRRSHTGEDGPLHPVCCSPVYCSHVCCLPAGVLPILLVRRFSGPSAPAVGASAACRWRLLIPGQWCCSWMWTYGTLQAHRFYFSHPQKFIIKTVFIFQPTADSVW